MQDYEDDDIGKKITKIVLSNIGGVIILAILLFIINNYVTLTDKSLNIILKFFNDNIMLFIIIAVIMTIAKISYALGFPFSLPAPVLSAVGSIFIIGLIFKIFTLVDILIEEDIFSNISGLKWVIYPVVFIIVIISGYVSVFFGALRSMPRREQSRSKEKIIDITPKKKDDKSWKDIGSEFRNMLHDILSRMRNKINKDDRKKKN